MTGTYSTSPASRCSLSPKSDEMVELLQVLEQLNPAGRGRAAGQLAADLARRLPTL